MSLNRKFSSGFGLTTECVICHSTCKVEKEHEVVCSKCGFVFGFSEPEPVLSQNKIAFSLVSKLGSKNIVDDGLRLPNLNKKHVAIILEKTAKHNDEFLRCCDMLGLSNTACQTASRMFTKLLPYKLGIGKTAVFCIYHTCILFEIIKDVDDIIQVIRTRYNLKRMMTLNNVLYGVQPTALEIGMLTNAKPSVSYSMKKYVSGKYHHTATKIFGCFPKKNNASTAKILQSFMENYT